MNTALQRTLTCGMTAVGIGLLAGQLIRSMSAYCFRDRVVVITGGSRGLGLILARQLAAEGARLAICARDEDELRVAVTELEQIGGTVFASVCDLSDELQVITFLQEVCQSLGPVDVLINNAGLIQVGPLDSMTVEDFSDALQIHFWAPLQAILHVLPDMRQRRSGRIVNIVSIGGEVAVPHLIPYCASKFALAGLSQALRTELAQEGIVVTTVSPGLMRTGSPRNAFFKGRHQEEYTWFSIGGALPLLSMNADRAACQILDACRYGQAHVVLSLPAKFATIMNTIAPNLVAQVASLVNRVLPEFGGIGSERRRRSESQSVWSPSWITTFNEHASRENNQMTSQSAVGERG